MRIPYRPLAIGLVTLAFSALVLARAQAGDRATDLAAAAGGQAGRGRNGKQQPAGAGEH